MLLELHINIPGCNEVSYWTRSGLIVWLNNLEMLLKVCISPQLFRITILLWGTPLIKPPEALLGRVHSITYLDMQQSGWTRCRGVRKISQVVDFLLFLQSWKLDTCQLLQPGLFHAWATTLGKLLACTSTRCTQHSNNYSSAVLPINLPFSPSSQGTELWTWSTSGAPALSDPRYGSTQSFGMSRIYPDATSQPRSPCLHREKETLSWEDRAELSLSFWETGTG